MSGAKLQRGAVDLREMLFETLDGLRDGSVKPRDAKAVCDVAGRIIETVAAEVNEIRIMRASLDLQHAISSGLSVEMTDRNLLAS